ncbi:MAG: TIGR01620 family protein [Rhodobacteraceae bacterium]|nr:TIGR01620 family protein [Paracoccaceae bacterium]
MTTSKSPLLIEDDAERFESPAEAAPVPDMLAAEGAAMQAVAAIAARKPSRLSKWFWRLLLALMTFALSVAAWDFVTSLVTRNLYVGYAALGLLALFLGVCVIIAVREMAALARLSRVGDIQEEVRKAREADDLAAARHASDRLAKLYSGRSDQRWGEAALSERVAESFDGTTVLDLTETTLLAPLDRAARAEVEAAARQVAAVTALVPLALADVVVALTANLRMIRRIAEVYGGRGGTLSAWRLTRAVMTHLLATGAMAVGDDLIGSVAGGGVLSRVSRRFGEGVINGALTARVGVAAMEVCRPMPFHAEPRPSVTSVVKSALTGLFSSSKDASD